MNLSRFSSSLLALAVTAPVHADSEPAEETATSTEQTSFYRSPYEQRIASLVHQPAKWLQLYGVAELEKTLRWQKTDNSGSHRDRDRAEHALRTLQLGAYAQWGDHLNATLILESEYAKEGYNRADEAYLSATGGGLSLNAGVMYYPISLTYTHFITPPLLEFAETRQPGALLSYSFGGFSVSGFAYDGEAEHQNKDASSDWGFGLNYLNHDESLRLSATYIADITDSEGLLLADQGNRYTRRIGAYSSSALYGWKTGIPGEITAELVLVDGDIPQLPPGLQRPESLNLELALFPTEVWQVAWRYEENRELLDAPARRYGVGLSWQFLARLNFAAEFLRSKFDHSDPARRLSDKQGNTLREDYAITTQLTLTF